MMILPISSQIYTLFTALAQSKRMVFMAGLPGVGKSLLIQQLALVAQQQGRKVHLIQWDVSRRAFEIPEILARYPEIDGVTDPMIRKGVGIWARAAVKRWDEQYPDPEHLLIGEAPLVGNRLVELSQVVDDESEALLRSDESHFLIPIPSWEVREVIEMSRERSIAEPQHELERWDASPDVLRALWQDVNRLARDLRLTKAGDDAAYNPYIYAGVYEALLGSRHAENLLVNQVLRPERSAYELDVVESVLAASPDEVLAIVAELEERYSREALVSAVANWHSTVTAEPKPVDMGPELLLPLPDGLPEAVDQIELNGAQLAAVHALLALPIETDAAGLLPFIDEALAVLASDSAVTAANVHKFDVYDSYFNVKRTAENGGVVFVAGMLQVYRQMLTNLETTHELTVVELPLLRMALDTVLLGVV